MKRQKLHFQLSCSKGRIPLLSECLRKPVDTDSNWLWLNWLNSRSNPFIQSFCSFHGVLDGLVQLWARAAPVMYVDRRSTATLGRVGFDVGFPYAARWGPMRHCIPWHSMTKVYILNIMKREASNGHGFGMIYYAQLYDSTLILYWQTNERHIISCWNDYSPLFPDGRVGVLNF